MHVTPLCKLAEMKCALVFTDTGLLVLSTQVYKQKVKHLLYEHQNNISTLKADGELGLKLAGGEAAKREAELQKDCRNLNLQLKEQVCFCCFVSAPVCLIFVHSSC